jgi:branched-chain amino acid transport system substrate-binding protein
MLPAAVRAEDDAIRIVAVDSSRVLDPEGPDARKPVPLPIRDGVAEIVSYFNEHGGLLGRRLAVTYENDRCEADEAAAIATRAVEHKAHVVIGHVCSSGAIRAAAIYTQAGIVMIATGPRHPRLTGPTGRRGIFRLAGRDDRQAESIAALIATAYPAARMAIVHDQSLQGRGMADDIRRSTIAAKVAPLLVAEYVGGTKDYAALVFKLMEANIDLVVFPGQPLEASMIVDQVRSAGGKIEIAIGTDVLAADAPPARLLAAMREFLVMLPWTGREFEDAIGAPDAARSTEHLLAMAGVEIWALAVLHVKELAAESVSAALRKPRGMPTMVGELHFDDKGDAVVPSFLPHVWKEGRWQVRR